MADVIYTFSRGASVRLALDVVTGNITQVLTITAKLRKLKSADAKVGTSDPVVATFVVTPRAATSTTKVGWNLVIPPSVTKDLPVGAYVGDARLTFGSDDADVTRSWVINLEEAVTRP